MAAIWLGDLKRHQASIKDLDKQLRVAVTTSGSTLTQIPGIGFLTAAKILALTGNIGRFPNGALRQLRRHRADRCLQR